MKQSIHGLFQLLANPANGPTHRLSPIGLKRAWHRIRGAGSTALAALLLVVGASAGAQEVRELDRIVAVVNSDVIVYSELLGRLEAVRTRLDESNTQAPPPHILARQVLDRLILSRIELQRAAEAGLQVDDELLDQSVADLAARNDLTLVEFRDILERDGYNYVKFRQEIRDELLISQVRQRYVNNRVTVSPRNVDNFLATLEKQGGGDSEYRIGHILVAVPEGASPEEIANAEVRANDIYAELSDGADFAQAAVANSDGQQALQGGDLGWRKAAELPTIFSELVPDMSSGDISEPIRSPSGFHIIELTDLRGGAQHVITQTHARHILIRPDELVTDDDALARLQGLHERISNGDDFAELARAHSQDPGSAMKGGELDWTSPGDLLPAFQAVMDSLEPGGLSEPFKTQFGWHLIQVMERRDYDGTEEVRRTNAISQIRQRKIEEELEIWLRQLRDEAYVELRLDEE